MTMKNAMVAIVLTLLLGAGCGSDDDEGSKPRPKPAKPVSKALTFAQVSTLPMGTPRASVVKKIGPPYRRQPVKPAGVVASCYRYGAVNEATGQVDELNEFRLCYDRRDRLSFKSTAPIE